MLCFYFLQSKKVSFRNVAKAYNELHFLSSYFLFIMFLKWYQLQNFMEAELAVRTLNKVMLIKLYRAHSLSKHPSSCKALTKSESTNVFFVCVITVRSLTRRNNELPSFTVINATYSLRCSFVYAIEYIIWVRNCRVGKAWQSQSIRMLFCTILQSSVWGKKK